MWVSTPSFGSTRLVLSLLAAAAKGALVRINLVHLYSMLTVPGLVLNALKVSHSVVPNSLQHHVLYSPWNSPGQNTGLGSRSLLQGIFPTQGSNPGLPHCSRILYQLRKEAQCGWALPNHLKVVIKTKITLLSAGRNSAFELEFQLPLNLQPPPSDADSPSLHNCVNHFL